MVAHGPEYGKDQECTSTPYTATYLSVGGTRRHMALAIFHKVNGIRLEEDRQEILEATTQIGTDQACDDSSLFITEQATSGLSVQDQDSKIHVKKESKPTRKYLGLKKAWDEFVNKLSEDMQEKLGPLEDE